MPYQDPRTAWTPDNGILADDLNRIEGNVKSLKTIERARGTTTALAISLGTLYDGYLVEFITSGNNNSNPTTINGVPLYHPGTQEPPRLLGDRAYKAWYSAVNHCFFICASATGSALAEQVLQGFSFTNDAGIMNVGTFDSLLPTRADIVDSTEITTGPYSGDGKNYTYLRIPKNTAFLNGVRWLQTFQPNLKSSNIIRGNTILGIPGTRDIPNVVSQRMTLNKGDKLFKYLDAGGSVHEVVAPYVRFVPGFTPSGYALIGKDTSSGATSLAYWTKAETRYAWNFPRANPGVSTYYRILTNELDYRCTAQECILPNMSATNVTVMVILW